MQVKVNTGEKVYRFNQKGQLIDTITEPYVSVDTRTREDLEALYDSLHEHIATAFTYEGNSITGLAAEYVNAIQNFLLVEGRGTSATSRTLQPILRSRAGRRATTRSRLKQPHLWRQLPAPRPAPTMSPSFRDSYPTPTSALS